MKNRTFENEIKKKKNRMLIKNCFKRVKYY